MLVQVSFFLAVLCSMLSQTPAYLESGVSQYLKLTWIIPFFLLLTTNHRAFLSKKLKFFYVFVVAFFSYCVILQFITGLEYMGADLYNIVISLMITVVSFTFWDKYASKRNLIILVCLLLLSGIYLAVTIYFQFLSITSLSQVQYAFDAKNSMGQILLNVAIVTITCYMPKNKLILIFFISLLCIMIAIIFMMKSRATLCGLFFVIGYYIVKNNNTSIRVSVASIVIIATFYIFLNSEAYKVVVEQIILGNRGISNINDLSSGRLNSIQNLIPLILEFPFFGSGNRYMDCFPLIILVQYGIVGSIIIWAFIFKCAYIIIHRIKSRDTYNLATFLLFGAAMINSLFEAQPPFGPGVKCFLLWMMFGFALSKMSFKKQYKLLGCSV